MFRRSSGIGVFVVATFTCLYLVAMVGGALASQALDHQHLAAFTDAFLADSAREAANHAVAMREVNDARLPASRVAGPTGKLAQVGSVPAMMPNVFPLFLQGRQFTSTLVLVNASAVSTYADVGFTARDGAQIATQRLQFTPHSQQTIDVGAVLASVASTATSGNISIMVSPGVQPSSIAAQLSMTYSGGPDPNYIDEELEMPSMNTSSILRGVAERSKGSPVIGITSLSDSSQTVAIQCLGNNGPGTSKSVSLLAGETLFTQACNAKTPYGADLETAMVGNDSAVRNSVGISLMSTANPGEFVAFGLAPQGDSDHRYFSGITFTDPKTLMSPNTTFTGVPMGRSVLLPDGNYVPELALANFSPKLARVRLKYAASSGSSPSVLDEGGLEVPGNTTRWIRLDQVRSLDILQNSFIVESDGAPGDLIAKMVSAGNSQLREIELPAKDELDVNNSGAHPWSLQDENESTLLLFNHGDQANDVNVVISTGSTIWEKAFRLVPMQTMALDIRQLIGSKTKGDKGETLPTDAALGMVEWFPGHSGGVAGRMLVSNRALAMARSFSCNQFEYLCSAEFSALNTLIVDGQTVDFGGLVPTICLGYTECGKNGTPEYQGGSGYTYHWSSANTGVISVSSVNTDGSVNTLGVAPGSTTVTGEVEDGTCTAQSGGGGTVTPSVTFIGGNSYIFAGSDSTVTLFNNEQVKGSPSGGTYSWSATGTNSGISFSPNNNTSADVSRLASTTNSSSSGDTMLSVGYTYNSVAAKTPATKAITVLKFEYLGGPTTVTLNYNGPNEYGYSTNAVYTVYTYPGEQALPTGYDGMSVAETVQGCSGCITGLGATNGNSQVVDNLAVISSQPLPSNYNVVATQTLSVGGYLVRNNTLTFTSTSVTIKNNGPTQ